MVNSPPPMGAGVRLHGREELEAKQGRDSGDWSQSGCVLRESRLALCGWLSSHVGFFTTRHDGLGFGSLPQYQGKKAMWVSWASRLNNNTSKAPLRVARHKPTWDQSVIRVQPCVGFTLLLRIRCQKPAFLGTFSLEGRGQGEGSRGPGPTSLGALLLCSTAPQRPQQKLGGLQWPRGPGPRLVYHDQLPEPYI